MTVAHAPTNALACDNPKFGDIVSCYFPEDETPNKPGKKPRPVMIVAHQAGSNGKPGLVLVAYGTSVRPEEPRRGEFTIDRPDSMAAAGLHRATKFTFKRIKKLPFDPGFFRSNRAGTAILGRLQQADLERAKCAFSQEKMNHESRSYVRA